MTAIAQPATGEYRRLKRGDLTGFDKTATALVLEASEHGWIGRLSSKGHAIMRAPDGETTMSVSRDSLRGRSGRNARAYFDRWLRAQEDPEQQVEPPTGPDTPQIEEKTGQGAPNSANATKDTPEPIKAVRSQNTASFVCGVCDRRFNTRASLGSHRRKHTLEDRPKVRCPYCGLSRKVLTYHLRAEHSVQAGDAFARGGEKALWRFVNAERKREQEKPMELDAQTLLASFEALVQERDRLRAENEDLRAKLDLARESLGL